MDRSDLAVAIILAFLIIIAFVLILSSCLGEFDRLEQVGLCKHLGYDDAVVTWNRYPEEFAKYTVNCIEYITLELEGD